MSDCEQNPPATPWVGFLTSLTMSVPGAIQNNDVVVFVFQQPIRPVNDKLKHIGHYAILSHQLVVTYR